MMKRNSRYYLVALLAMAALNMSAQTVVTFDASEDKGTCTSENPGADQVTKDGVTIAVSSGCMDMMNHYRCYQGADFTVTSTSEKILMVEITCTADGDKKYGPGCFTASTSGTYDFEDDSPVGTWKGNAVTFSLNATKQVRITKVVVTVGDDPAEPTFSVPEGVYFEPQSVTFDVEAGCRIIYTLNGVEPAYTDDSHYTGTVWDGSPLNISETTTLKAIAVKGNGKASYVATATYTIVNIQGEAVFDASEEKGNRPSSDPGDDLITKDGVTIAVGNGCMNLIDHYRCYQGADFTVNSTGAKIVKVEITCTASGDTKYGPGCLTNPTVGTYSFEEEGSVGTWIGNAASFSLSATKQVRISKVVVTFGDTPVEPTFGIEEGVRFGLQKVSLNCSPDNFILYTTNGEEPSYTDDLHYTGKKYDGTELNIAETTTVKAIAVNHLGKSSEIVAATYTIINTEGKGTAESPFSIADAIMVMTALEAEGITPMYYTKGVVVGDVTMDGGGVIFHIGATADATTDLVKVFKPQGPDRTNIAEGEVKAGDEVVVYASLQIYDGTPETWRGYVYSINGQTSEPSGVQTLIAEKSENAAIYNLQGVRFFKPRKGPNIINGKIVVVK